MRIKYNQSFHKLQLKLGYSNIITIDVPASIQIFKNKDVLTIEGNNATTVDNFTNSVRNLKYPDSYKRKGIQSKNEFRTLKPVKKVQKLKKIKLIKIRLNLYFTTITY